MGEPIGTANSAILVARYALLAGSRSMPIGLGLTSRALHLERAERECFGAAIPSIATILGPAARLLEIGPFAGQALGQMLVAMERPKAAVIMTADLDARQYVRLQEITSTAEITHIEHDATGASWPLDPIGAGRTLLISAGGGFGFTPPMQASSILQHASQKLQTDDLIALTLEIDRDAALLEVTYRDFGNQLVTQALSNLGRAEYFETKTFYDAQIQRVRFGALAGLNASLAWNGTRCEFEQGTWLDFGAMQLHTQNSLMELHPDFQIHDQWESQDKAVTLLLLRKI